MYLDLAKELKNLWNMNVTVIGNVIDALTTVAKGLKELEIKVRVETIETKAFLRSTRKREDTCDYSNSSGRRSAE